MRLGVLARLSTDLVETTLRDGTSVVVRPVGPGDRDLIRQARFEFDSHGVLRIDIPLQPELMPDTPVVRAVRAAASKVSPEAGRFDP